MYINDGIQDALGVRLLCDRPNQLTLSFSPNVTYTIYFRIVSLTTIILRLI